MNDRATKLVIAVSGASGAIYARATLQAAISLRESDGLELAMVASKSAPEVWEHELDGPPLADFAKHHDVPIFAGRNYRAPFASGSAGWDAMVIAPCSMSTLAKVAHGISDDLLSRAADVMLKERRKLIVVARETPLSVIHLENMLSLARAGAMILPATPSFYGRPATIDALVHSIITRIFDHLGYELKHAKRWGHDVKMEPR
jgi:4-hydroxy-3-polyprenylbenzoate decarboxylase